jgi:putative Holliday junction resolvase
MSRILSVDFGEKRIGLAISDELKVIAKPYKTIENRGKKYVINQLINICRNFDIEKLIVGLPKSLSGKEGIQAEKVKNFAKFLTEKIKLPIVLEDERFTTEEAEKFLEGESLRKKTMRKDQLAAFYILQNYLEKNQ